MQEEGTKPVSSGIAWSDGLDLGATAEIDGTDILSQLLQQQSLASPTAPVAASAAVSAAAAPKKKPVAPVPVVAAAVVAPVEIAAPAAPAATVSAVDSVVSSAGAPRKISAPPGLPDIPRPSTTASAAYKAVTVDPFALLGLSAPSSAAAPLASARLAPAPATAAASDRHVSSRYSVRL